MHSYMLAGVGGVSPYAYGLPILISLIIILIIVLMKRKK